MERFVTPPVPVGLYAASRVSTLTTEHIQEAVALRNKLTGLAPPSDEAVNIAPIEPTTPCAQDTPVSG
jgi:hypothetical protein